MHGPQWGNSGTKTDRRAALASVVFAVIVIGTDAPNSGAIAMVVVCTVTLSTILHGVTANPWVRTYGGAGGDAHRRE
jgi:hypothetical protein